MVFKNAKVEIEKFIETCSVDFVFENDKMVEKDLGCLDSTAVVVMKF